MISLDTSTSATGVGVFVNGKYKDSYVLETDKKIKGDDKLNQMIGLLHSLLLKEKPDIVITELVVPTRNASATRMLQELTGSVRGFCIEHKISYDTLRPSEWRSVIVKSYQQKPRGRKREDQKEWSLDIVNNKLDIITTSDDQSDAILLGISYIETFK